MRLGVAACGGGQVTPDKLSPAPSLRGLPANVAVDCQVDGSAPPRPTGAPVEPDLRSELLLMKDADQVERTGASNGDNDSQRTERADATEVAYLVDRIMVNFGRPQIYGTQFGGCRNNRPVPHPIADEAGEHERRVRMGLQPLEEYLAQFQDGC